MSLKENSTTKTMSQKGFDESSLGTSWSSSEPFSSGLSTPFGSELGSTETESGEDEEFMAELTRQMANYMLEDDENTTEMKACDSSANKWSGCNSTSTYYCDQRLISTSTESNPLSAPVMNTTIEVYQLTNQPLINEESCLRYGNLSEKTKSPKQQSKLQQQHERQHQHHMNNIGKSHGGNNLASPNGPGMRAIFLNGSGSGSRNGSTGTGVFLPRMVHNQTTEPKKRPGCSTVLIPAKVLQALETHFNYMDALSQSKGCGASTNRNPRGDMLEQKRTSELQTQSTSNNQAIQLPEDWTY